VTDVATKLTEVLDRARAVGFLGPGPIASHIEHAERYGPAVDATLDAVGTTSASTSTSKPPVGDVANDLGPVDLVDIGAGGGVPSLPLLVARPSVRAVLVDASQKRCSFLVWAVAELGMGDRVSVWASRAEAVGREDRGRQRFSVLVARGFGPPASTLECGAPLVIDGGRLVISEPPERRRWPASELSDRLGLVEVPSPPGVVVFERRGPVPEDVPRSAKEMQRRPLFAVE
jgi:16S rRNA (guanine527-N7)-methyltransferase